MPFYQATGCTRQDAPIPVLVAIAGALLLPYYYRPVYYKNTANRHIFLEFFQ